MYTKLLLSTCLLLVCVWLCHSIYTDISDHTDVNKELVVGDKTVPVNSYEQHIAVKCLVDHIKHKPTLLGHQSIIDEIDSISDMWFQEQTHDIDSLYKPPTGILLYGPPGTGKTTLSKHIAHTLFGGNVSFLNVSSDTFENKYQGEGLKYLKSVFTLAVKLAPCVLFFDEIDGFMSKRSDSDQTHVNGMKTTFLSGMDHVIDNNDTDRVLVICATNRPKSLDGALMRRMEIHFCTDYPSIDDKCHAMRSFDVLSDDDIRRFVSEILPHKSTIHDINTFLRFCVRKRFHKKTDITEWSFETLHSMYNEYKSVFKFI